MQTTNYGVLDPKTNQVQLTMPTDMLNTNVDFSNSDVGVDVSVPYLEVDTWKEMAVKAKYFWCVKMAETIMFVADKDGVAHELPAVVLMGIFSANGAPEDGAKPKLYMAAQHGVVNPLKPFPQGTRFRIIHVGKKKTKSGHDVQQFSVELLKSK